MYEVCDTDIAEMILTRIQTSHRISVYDLKGRPYMGSYSKNGIWSYAGPAYDHMSQIICRKSYMVIICSQIICGQLFKSYVIKPYIVIIYDRHIFGDWKMLKRCMFKSYVDMCSNHMWSNHIYLCDVMSVLTNMGAHKSDHDHSIIKQ